MLEVITPSAPPCQVTASSAFGSDRGQLFPRGMGPPPIRPALPRQHDKQLQMFGQRPRDFQPRPQPSGRSGEHYHFVYQRLDRVIAKPIRREVYCTLPEGRVIGKAIRHEVYCTLPAQATTPDSQFRDRPSRLIHHRICARTSRTSRQLPAGRPAPRPRICKHNAQR